MKLNKDQRETISKIFVNLGTVIFVSVVLGKYITANPISAIEFTIGLLATVVCFIISIYVLRGV